MPVWFYTLIFFALFGGYWWYSSGRYGNSDNYMQKKMKLDEGEELNIYFLGQFSVDFKASDIALALVGTSRVGKPLIIGISNKDRLILRENAGIAADEPIYITRNQVKEAIILEKRFGKITGPDGKAEKMATLKFTFNDGEVMGVSAPESGAQAMLAWWKGVSSHT